MKNNVITYTVGKSMSNNLYISVQGVEVAVQAPWYFSKNRIQEAVEEKRAWILKKIEEGKRENLNFNPIEVLGIKYNLKVIFKNIKIIECNILRNIIEIYLPKKCKKIDNKTMTSILIDKMYKKIAEREIEAIIEKIRIKVGFMPEDYEIKEFTGAIAKCTDNKKIMINPLIMRYDRKLIEYIILHEFCHLKYKNHTKRFYELLQKYCDNYNELDEELKEINY